MVLTAMEVVEKLREKNIINAIRTTVNKIADMVNKHGYVLKIEDIVEEKKSKYNYD